MSEWLQLGLLGFLMAAFALIGSVTLFIHEKMLSSLLPFLVAFAAGSLIGGAFFHMIPEALSQIRDPRVLSFWVVFGFFVFFNLEQFFQWHHSHFPRQQRPLTYLILIADGLHNFLGGASVAATFLLDWNLGKIAWLSAALHEIPQELGDFAILVQGGWTPKKALWFNFLSALTFPLGMLISLLLSHQINTVYLVPFAAGNFIYIAAADLIPEIKQSQSFKQSMIHLVSFTSGLIFLGWLAAS